MAEQSLVRRRNRRRRSKKTQRMFLVLSGIFVLLSVLVMLRHFSYANIQPAMSASEQSAPAPQSQPASVIVPDPVKSALKEASAKKHADLLRKFPYPYQAMLAISSDADMATLAEFEDYHRFLNTKEQTPHGQGLGLDIGDSSWLYIANDTKEKVDQEGHSVDNSMSYFQGLNPDKLKDANKIVHYFKVGWIDSLHTFGDFSRNDHAIKFSRNLAVASWNAMNQSGFKPEVWINHGSESNVQNFGAYNPRNFAKYQAGDDPKSPYYHTDLTLKNGIRYVWDSVGENQFSYDDPLFKIHLRDGQNVWGFHRYTDEINKGKIEWMWETQFISRQITPQRLEQLAQQGKYSIVGQHLGKGSSGFPFSPEGIQTLRLLKSSQDEGKILVARTSRLLDYARSLKYVQYSVAEWQGKTYINIEKIEDPVLGSSIPSLDEIRGLTFYVNDPENTVLLLNLNPIHSEEIQQNAVDKSEKKSIEIKWFPADYADHTQDL